MNDSPELSETRSQELKEEEREKKEKEEEYQVGTDE